MQVESWQRLQFESRLRQPWSEHLLVQGRQADWSGVGYWFIWQSERQVDRGQIEQGSVQLREKSDKGVEMSVSRTSWYMKPMKVLGE